MGHGSMRAALIYQHATNQRDREIADALQKLIEREPTEMWPVRGPRSSSGIPGRRSAVPKKAPTRAFVVERVTRIELA
jgi:hypothetical protein